MTEETKNINEIKQDLADFKYDFEKLSKVFSEYKNKIDKLEKQIIDIEAARRKSGLNKIIAEKRLSEIVDSMENGD